MKKFEYRGKTRTAAADKLLFPGCQYELNEKDAHIESLIAQKLLVEIKAGKENPVKEKK